MTGSYCYATDSGLGIQAKAFYDHGLIDKFLIRPHSSYPTHHEWYPDTLQSEEELLDCCDTLVFFETPFNWKLIEEAKKCKKKTVLVAMYECTRFPFPYQPDVLIGGSAIETKHYKDLGCHIPCHHINVPVEVKWKLRKEALTFIHNAGHLGIGGRNGTKELIEAMKYVKSPVKLKIRSQVKIEVPRDSRIDLFIGTVPHEELWSDGDILIFPEKFGGSFLPMQEAFASGMPVMASDRFPTNSWLPNELLIPVNGYVRTHISAPFDMAILDPKKIAAKIDEWYGKDISKFSMMGKKWAEENSWKNLKPKYEALIRR